MMFHAIALWSWVAAADLLAPMDAETGARILADKPGGTVEAVPLRGKGTVILKDGAEVRFDEDGAGVGEGENLVVIQAGKRKLKVPAARVLTERDLKRSPDGKWAVFTPVTGCGDLCHREGWLIGPGVRTRLAEDVGPEVQVAWRPDGGELAMSGGTLWVIALPDGKVSKDHEFQAPVYAPDGRLFVRGPAGNDAVHLWIRGARPRKVLAVRGKPPALEEGEYFREISPPTIEDGRLSAEFERGKHGGKEYRSVQLADLDKANPASAMPASVEKALVTIVADETVPAAASKLAADEGKTHPAFARPLASAANTRGLRLYQAGKPAEALLLFETAAQLDATYGMPRYNAARVLAGRGDAAGCARWLATLKALGTPQRARLEQVKKDPAFAKVLASAEVGAVLP